MKIASSLPFNTYQYHNYVPHHHNYYHNNLFLAHQTAWRFDELQVEQRLLLRGLSHVGTTLSFEDWLTHWSLLALNEPAITQVREKLAFCSLLATSSFVLFCTLWQNFVWKHMFEY